MPSVDDSILDVTKKLLGLEADYTVFDMDILTHINTSLFNLQQLGVGPEKTFFIEDSSQTYADFLGEDSDYNATKTYIYMKVRLAFDPPATSFAITSFENQIKELEWRLNIQREGAKANE